MSPDPASNDPLDRAVDLLARARALLLDCRVVADELAKSTDQTSSTGGSERIAYGVLVGALEEGLVNTLEHALGVLRNFRTPAGALGEEWLRQQERRLEGTPGSDTSGSSEA